MCCCGDGGEGGTKGGGGGEGGRRVQSTVHREMKWIIECGINTANNLGSPFQTERTTRERGREGKRGGRDGRREKGERVRENPGDPLGGKAAIEKLLNLHLAGLIGNEEAY